MKKLFLMCFVVALCAAVVLPVFAGAPKKEGEAEKGDPLAGLTAEQRAVVERAQKLTK